MSQIGVGGTEIGNAKVDLSRGILLIDVGDQKPIRPEFVIAKSVSGPSSAENRFLLIVDFDLEVVLVRSVLVGSSSPSVTWNLRHDADRSATGLDVFDGDETTTTTTTYAEATDVLWPKIDAGEFLWLVTTAMSGTVLELGLGIYCRWRP